MVERDRHLASCAKVDPDSFLKDAGVSNRYSSKQTFHKNSESMKKIIKENIPQLIEEGYCTISADHKWCGSLVKEPGDHGLSVMLHASSQESAASYTLCFIACEKTTLESTLPVVTQVLEVKEIIKIVM
jgi:hypothetical protein